MRLKRKSIHKSDMKTIPIHKSTDQGHCDYTGVIPGGIKKSVSCGHDEENEIRKSSEQSKRGMNN